MSRNYPLILLIMIICCAKTKGAAVFCYQCSGLTCEPLEKYLQPCDNDLNRPVARCYSVAWNLTNIYRGCYESADDNIEHCRDRRLTNCAICFGNGCNNQPLFQPMTKTITCKHCPYGMCPLHGLPRDDFHMCEPFLMTVTPSCYQLIDYAIGAYVFGCTNALSADDFHFCSQDRLKLSCRFCYTDNCNNAHHSYYLAEWTSTRKRCADSITTFISNRYCDRYTILTPYAHCFVEVNFLRPRVAQFVGCTSAFPESETKYTVQHVNYFHCWENDCNHLRDVKKAIADNHYRPCIDNSEPNNVTFGARLDGCCALSEYRDEKDTLQTFSGCESKLNCLMPGICVRCCDDQTNFLMDHTRITCNLKQQSFTNQCYRCKGCLTVSNEVLANQTYCMAAPNEERACFTYQDGETLFRGCYHDKFFSLNEGLSHCRKDMKNCKVCRGELCNEEAMVTHCYQCLDRNHNCQYDQRLAGYLQECPYPGTGNASAVFPRRGCYLMKKLDGTMERGCDSDAFRCPPTADCSRCNGVGCNYEGFKIGHCISCSGDDRSQCAVGDNRNGSVECPISFRKPLCYTFFDGLTGMVYRGCTTNSIYTAGYLERCAREDNSTCISCDSNNCNYFTKRIETSGGYRFTISRGTLLLLFVYSLFPGG